MVTGFETISSKYLSSFLYESIGVKYFATIASLVVVLIKTKVKKLSVNVLILN